MIKKGIQVRFGRRFSTVLCPPQGLEETARRVHTSALLLAKGLADSGNDIETGLFFDTIKVQPRLDQSEIRHRAKEMKINLRYFDEGQVQNYSLQLMINER